MKNKKTKDAFVMQYYGQRVWSDGIHTQIFPVSSLIISDTENTGYLLLRSIEQLTDDEYCTVMELMFQGKGYSIAAIKDIIDGWLSLLNKETGGYLPKNYLTLIDYLRTIGILLPFTFLDEEKKPKTLTPTEIVNAGWVKLNK